MGTKQSGKSETIPRPEERAVNRRFSQDFSGESKTQQHFQPSCDVNNIVAAFQSTGVDPYADRLAQQRFGYASSQDFSEAMRNVAEINTAFAELPSDTRQEFGNDPAAWLDQISTPQDQVDEIVDSEPSEEVEIPPETADSDVS